MCLYRTVYWILNTKALRTPYPSFSTSQVTCIKLHAHCTIFICITSIVLNSIDIGSLTFHSHTRTFHFLSTVCTWFVLWNSFAFCFRKKFKYFILSLNLWTLAGLKATAKIYFPPVCSGRFIYVGLYFCFFVFRFFHLWNGSMSIFMVSIKMQRT